jgi:hypothetical protein
MATSIRVSLIALALVTGCSSTLPLQPGLASAPKLGKDTPETRVHDVIANGHDACERTGFPPGEVLRGHVPPCSTEKSAPVVTTFFGEPRPPRAWVTQWHGFGVCGRDGTGFARAEVSVPGLSVSPGDIVCDAR